MNDLLAQVLVAHGGLDRWNTFNKVTATVVSGGGLFPMKGIDTNLDPREATAMIHEEVSTVSPYGQPDRFIAFKPDRVAIETTSGAVISERLNPRASFAGHTMTTQWDPLHRAYFSGYALWTYLTTPFLLAMPGVEVTEIAPWQEGDETWRGLRACFPDSIASHSKEQDFYFGDDFLLRRHDYFFDIGGGYPAAHYVYDIVEADGFYFPGKRRVYMRGKHLQPIYDLLLVWIELTNFRVTA